MKNSYTEAEIDSMVADVTTKLDALLKSEGATLVKKNEDCAPGGEPMQMSAPDASAPPDASASAPAPDASPSPSPDASPSPAPEGSEPQAPASLEELVQAYSSLSPEELQMHAQALAQVMQGQQAQPAAPDASMSGQPPAAPLAGEGSQPVQPEAQAAMKSEIASLSAQLADLKKSTEQLVGIVTTVIKAKPEQVKTEVKTVIVPVAGKAVTGDNALIKTEDPVKPLTKGEVVTKLNEKARDPNLAKSDRALIRKYYHGVATLNQLSHLLK